LAVIALGGAATNPTVTYHGVFDDTAELSDPCPDWLTANGWSGVWNLQLKGNRPGMPVMVQATITYDGTPHAIFRLPFEVEPQPGLVLHAEQDPVPGMDHGEVSLGKDGSFTYTRDLNFPGWVCRATFTGHLTN
jgi:hypothetical protein